MNESLTRRTNRFRVLIFGGRDFVPKQEHWDLLDYLLADWLCTPDELTIVSGKARGADTFGEHFAALVGAWVDEFPADWDKHGKGAGFIRNQQMLDSGIDYAIQFPGGNGTADMRRRLDAAGVQVWEVKE